MLYISRLEYQISNLYSIKRNLKFCKKFFCSKQVSTYAIKIELNKDEKNRLERVIKEKKDIYSWQKSKSHITV